MSTTPFTGPRPAPHAPLLALAVAAVGLLTPITGGAATAQTTPTAAARTATAALLDRPARLRVRDVSLADALGELERRSGVPLAYSPSLLPRDR
jgi:hypothetical protein